MSGSRRTTRLTQLQSPRPYGNLINVQILPTTSHSNSSINNNGSTLQFGFINIRSLTTKALLVNQLIQEHKFQLLGLCETWLRPHNEVPLIEASPDGYTHSHIARTANKAGGVGFIYNSSLNIVPDLNTSLTSCEIIILRPPHSGNNPSANPTFYFIIVYRSPGPYSAFLEELFDFLSDLSTRVNHVLIIGDFNIHVNTPNKSLPKAFLSHMDTLGYIQHIHEPTHKDGNTLDLVLSRGITVSHTTVLPYPISLSDHYLLKFQITLPQLPQSNLPSNSTYSTRNINDTTAAALGHILSSTLTSLPAQITALDTYIETMDSIHLDALDSIAPLQTKTSRNRKPTPWFNNDTRRQKRICRKLERKWRILKLDSTHQQWRNNLVLYKSMLSQARTTYYSTLINNNKNNPRFLFNTVTKLTRKPTNTNTLFTPTQILNFFNSKIDNIRTQIGSHTSKDLAPPTDHYPEPLPPSFSQFSLVSLDTLSHLVLSAKSSTFPLDPITAKLNKDLFPINGPYHLNIINTSLFSGTVPSSYKSAVVKPLLKKPNLSPDILDNFRPISNLPFYSKILEKIVSLQLIDHLHSNNLFESCQSGFRKLHSTETALTKIINDLLMYSDSNTCSLLIQLDLTAAFDTIVHPILLNRMSTLLNITGTALSWFTSYLSDRTQCVSYGGSLSEKSPINHGVPQGSVLGPLLFSIYMLPLGSILRHHGIQFHCYADDTQIYIPLTRNDHQQQLTQLESCLHDITNWLSDNFLKLNPSKTELLVIGPKNQIPLHSNLSLTLNEYVVTPSPTVRNLGVQLDQHLSFTTHIADISRSALFHLHNIRKIRPILTDTDAATLIHTLVSSRLDYCNTLFSGLPACTTNKLQSVQNTAARILTRTRKYDRISPVLKSLHWLPIKERSDFKVLLLTYKSLHGLAPSYLSDLITPYHPSRPLRSQNAGLLTIPHINKITVGGRAFSYRAPALWKELPPSVRNSTSVEMFKSRLKTHLFTKHFGD